MTETAPQDRLNALGQPIGFPVPDWKGVERPTRAVLGGRLTRVEPLNAGRHAAQLFAADHDDREARTWTYLPYGPFEDFDEYQAWVDSMAHKDDPQFYAICDAATGKAIGVASYLRIEPAVGVIEVGHIHFSPRLSGTTMATEAMYLMMRHVFDDLGYRRYEWKCDALNAPSRRAAERLGFTFEGIFRQATLYRGRNRDTAWFSILDSEWPAQKAAFEAFLAPENFDADGRQKSSLAAFRG